LETRPHFLSRPFAPAFLAQDQRFDTTKTIELIQLHQRHRQKMLNDVEATLLGQDFRFLKMIAKNILDRYIRAARMPGLRSDIPHLLLQRLNLLPSSIGQSGIIVAKPGNSPTRE